MTVKKTLLWVTVIIILSTLGSMVYDFILDIDVSTIRMRKRIYTLIGMSICFSILKRNKITIPTLTKEETKKANKAALEPLKLMIIAFLVLLAIFGWILCQLGINPSDVLSYLE